MGFENRLQSSHEVTPAQKNVDPLLWGTIYNEAAKEQRRKEFEGFWQERWKPRGVKDGYFQTKEDESPFSAYSSKGWKIHIAFEKGKEKEVSGLLYENGLYFKTEAGSGTYFNGLNESGATIYIGSHDNMEQIAKTIEEKTRKFLKDGTTTKVGDRVMRKGSGSDIEIRPKIMARFDIAKTEFGWLQGNKRYAEYGLPSWSTMGGIPILQKYEKEASNIESAWNKFSDYQRNLYLNGRLKEIYEDSKRELIRDFGKEFLFGS